MFPYKAISFLILLTLASAACSVTTETNTPTPQTTLPPEPSPTVTFGLFETVTLTSEANMSPEPSPTGTSGPFETVTFTTEDNVSLAGTLFGSGKIAVILAHQGTYGADQTTWQPFARLLAERGYTALTFDFRGVGQSKGLLRYGDLWIDVMAATKFLQARGYSQIVCAGASMGGTACIYNAAREEYMGLIVLASTMMAGTGENSLRISDDDLAKLMLPKLFITAQYDYYSVINDTKRMAELSPDPVSLLLLPETNHGTDLFNTDSGEKLIDSMLEFLDSLQSQILTPELSPQLDGTTGPIYSMAWSPNGRVLASAGYGQVKLWDAVTRQELATLTGHSSYVWGVAWSPDGSTLASASQDGTVRLWDAASLENTTVLETGWAFSVSWSPDGKYLVVGTGSGISQIWDKKTHKLVRELVGSTQIISIAWSPEGRTIAVGEWDGKIIFWDSDTGEQLKSLIATTLRSDVNGLVWSPDGSMLASAHQDGRVRLWDSETGEILVALEGHRGWVRGLAWSPDGSLLASTGEDAEIRVWKVHTEQLLNHLKPDFLPSWSLAWSPDGKWLAVGNGAYENITTGGKVLILEMISTSP